MKMPHRPSVLSVGLALVAGLIIALLVIPLRTPERLPDFDAIGDVDTRKQAFFAFLAPLVEAENERVMYDRARLLALNERLESGQALGGRDRHWLKRMAGHYDVEWHRDDPVRVMQQLARRVDTVPVSLALVQAAAESGWGRSRFAVDGNNLFGQWCYTRGCGMVPSRRAGGAQHEVESFVSVRESVSRYIHNLNTHSAYAPLREIRARLREADREPTAMVLADGLIRYSERREDYVEEVKSVIRVNRPLIEQVIHQSPN
ncbi:MAG: glucosaminidase domain-containing protein [Xanthomonadaceae bacterium]|nr:glucosaminidase domain-containing protein [Xanthomonadaceae bacterium]